jgi:hypothetical protein
MRSHRSNTDPHEPTKPKRVDEQDGPPAADLETYDRKLKELFELETFTSQASWPWFFGGLLADSTAAAKALKSCEKMNDVIRCQATIAYAESQLAKLAQVVQDLNDQSTRYPLFTQDYPYRADFDELTGRVTVIHLNPEDRALPRAGLGGPPVVADASAGAELPSDPILEPEPLPEPDPGDPFDD